MLPLPRVCRSTFFGRGPLEAAVVEEPLRLRGVAGSLTRGGELLAANAGGREPDEQDRDQSRIAFVRCSALQPPSRAASPRWECVESGAFMVTSVGGESS
jgi:hypothetical protein